MFYVYVPMLLNLKAVKMIYSNNREVNLFDRYFEGDSRFF